MEKISVKTLLKKTNDIYEFDIKKRLNEEYELLTEKLINESYGSFEGQYKAVKNLVKQILDKKEKGEYIDNVVNISIKESGEIPGIGKINLIVVWEQSKNSDDTPVSGKSVYEDNEHNIFLTVKWGNTPMYNIASTMAHEIMHCFQRELPNVKDINVNSMILYNYLLLFQSQAPEEFSHYFFYGMYITFFIERTANISSVSNFMEEYFKNKDKNKISTLEYQNALKKCDKYQMYEEVLENMLHREIKTEDINYINKCLTGKFKNMYNNNEDIILFNPTTFNVQTFINKKKEEIINLCQETIEKMYKNIINFIEN